ncbi:MAG: hypothetical protein ACEPO8_09215 [Rhodothermaceae bacterium]
MKPKLIILLVLLKISFSISLYGQILIQEKIKLNQKTLSKVTGENHIVTCTISWTDPKEEFKILHAPHFGNPVTLTNVEPGGTTFHIRVSKGIGSPGDVSYVVTFDGRIIKKGVVQHFNGENYNLHVSYPIQKSFLFIIPDIIGKHNEIINVIPHLGRQKWIIPGRTFDTDIHKFTLSIVKGGEYFEYAHKTTEVPYGPTVKYGVKDPEFRNIALVQKKEIDSSEPFEVILKAEINNLSILDTGYVYPFDTFMEASFEEQVIKEGDTTNIILEERNFFGDVYDVDYYYYDPLTVWVDSSQNAYLHNPRTKEISNRFYNINNPIELIAADNISEDTVIVKFNVEGKYDDSIILSKSKSANQNLKTKKAYGIIKIVKEKKNYIIPKFSKVLTPGDTIGIDLYRQKGENEPENFNPNQKFEVGVSEGCEFAKILTSDNKLGNYFDSLKQPIRVVIVEEVLSDSLNLKLKIGVIDDSVKYYPKSVSVQNEPQQNFLLKKGEDTPLICENYDFNLANFATLENEVELPVEIMLGETKYFQMLRIPKAGVGNFEYKIKEVKKFDTQGNPQMDLFAVKANVWGDNPVKVISGGKSGIFYDKFVADIGLNGTTTKPVVSELENGLIRVVGRYWEVGKTYSTELTAKIPDSDISAKATIEVIKPDKLGDKYNRIYDFPDKAGNLKEWDLDSLIISFAGKEGIMPQIVKGIIHCESVIQKGTSKIKPSYRYEVFSDGYGYLRNYGLDSTSIYWIKSEADEGNPSIPNHGEVWLGSSTKFDKYPGYQTGWEFLQKYKHLYYYTRKEVDDSYTDSSLVGVCLTAYKTQNEKIAFFKKKFTKKLQKIVKESSLLKDTVRTLIHNSYEKYLKDSINVYGEGGLSNMICQTRLFASYGLMQLTYNSGIDKKLKINEDIFYYPKNNTSYLPEYINVPDINIKYGILHLKYKLRQFALGKIKFKETDTWDKNHALEKAYWVALRKYNGKYTYPNKVFSFSKLYVPLMNKEK